MGLALFDGQALLHHLAEREFIGEPANKSAANIIEKTLRKLL